MYRGRFSNRPYLRLVALGCSCFRTLRGGCGSDPRHLFRGASSTAGSPPVHLPPGSTAGSPRSMVFRPSRDSRGVSVWPPCRAAFRSRRNGASRGRPRKTLVLLVVHAPRCALPEEPDPVAFDPRQVFDRAPEGSVRSLWCVRRPAPPSGPWEESTGSPVVPPASQEEGALGVQGRSVVATTTTAFSAFSAPCRRLRKA